MKEVVIVGGGYSVKEGIEKGLWDKIKGKEIWSLNFAYRFMPYLPTRELWGDLPFFKNNISDLQRLYEAKVELHAKNRPLYHTNLYEGKIHTYEVTPHWNEHEKKVYNGTSLGLVGTFALSLACKQGYDVIYLLGYDFGAKSNTDLNTHFYVDEAQKHNIQSTGLKNPNVFYEGGVSIKAQVTDYDNYKTAYQCKIYNVSRDSNIHSFQKITYDEFFSLIEDK